MVRDESIDERRGKVAPNGHPGQVGVFLSIANGRKHNWHPEGSRGELFLPEAWFDEGHQELREQVGMTEARSFQTKIEL